MFGHRFFGARHFGPRYFGDGDSTAPPLPTVYAQIPADGIQAVRAMRQAGVQQSERRATVHASRPAMLSGSKRRS